MKSTTAIVLLAIYAAIAIWLIYGYTSYLHRPGGGTWDKVRDYVAESDHPEAPIRFSPGWFRNYASDMGRFQGLNLTVCESCPIYWQVSTPADAPAGYRKVDSSVIDGLEVSLMALASLNVEAKTSMISKDPKVSLESNGTVQECSFKGSLGKGCWAHDWQRIQRTVVKSGGQPKKCLFTHPREGIKINLVYDKVTLGDRISFTSAIEDGFNGGGRSPVYVDAYVDGAKAGSIVQDDSKGWTARDIDTSKDKGRSAQVKFVVYTENDERRHFCFDADVV